MKLLSVFIVILSSLNSYGSYYQCEKDHFVGAPDFEDELEVLKVDPGHIRFVSQYGVTVATRTNRSVPYFEGTAYHLPQGTLYWGKGAQEGQAAYIRQDGQGEAWYLCD